MGANTHGLAVPIPLGTAICLDCGGAVIEMTTPEDHLTADEITERSRATEGRTLCYECYRREVRRTERRRS